MTTQVERQCFALTACGAEHRWYFEMHTRTIRSNPRAAIVLKIDPTLDRETSTLIAS